ncbi:MAG: helix-turn-helix domain-containing protein [Caldisericum exile]
MVEVRNKRNMSQKEFMKKIRTSQSAIARFKRGNINSTLEYVLWLAGAFNT